MGKASHSPSTPEVCPVCGEDVPPRSLACPECGADHRSGWNEENTWSDGLNLSDNEFNYEEYVENEFGEGTKPAGISSLWWVVGIVLLAILLAGALGMW